MTDANLPARMQAFYERLNTEKGAGLEELPELYWDDIQFISPIEERVGLEKFRESWATAFSKYKAFTFKDFKCIGDDKAFALFYTMTIDIGVGRPMPTPTATLFIAREGKVYYQYDYWDTVAGLSEIYPPLHTAYQWAVALLLGGGAPVESDPNVHVPRPARDGLYHPSSEAELISLVRKSFDLGGKLRVVGSGHSVWESIIPDGFDPKVDTNERLVSLDRYRRILSFRDDPKNPGCALVEVEAGCYLGESPRHPVANPLSVTARFDPSTPNVTHSGSWEESLNYALDERGYALPDLGGISHQAVGGFLSTGSAGGSCKWSVLDSVVAFRVIDGQGQVHVLREDGPDYDAFAAIGSGLGLSGLISTVTFRAVPKYNIVGKETVSATRDAPDLDFYGKGDASRPSLARFLEQTDYSRLMWWPQRDFDRLVVWQASRDAPRPDFKPNPYEEVGKWPVAKQAAASLLYTVLGNLDDPHSLRLQIDRLRTLGHDFGSALAALATALRGSPAPTHDLVSKTEEKLPFLGALASRLFGDEEPAITRGSPWVRVVEVIAHMLDTIAAGVLSSELFEPLAKLLSYAAPHLIGTILSPFVALAEDGGPAVQHFQDVWYLGLPMDNGMDDVMMPTFFTELWIPFTQEGGEVERAIAAMRKLFDADGTAKGCYEATGPFCIEMYATKGGSKFHLDPACGEKSLFRVDVFWFGYNGGDPVKDFYPRFWEALDGLEYRLHWGKFLPDPASYAPSKLTSRFPDFARWKATRERLDPGGVFLTPYWSEHLGL